MKYVKSIIFILVFLFCINTAFAYAMPTYTNTVPKDVYGFLSVDKKFEIYDNPSLDAKLIQTIKWNERNVFLIDLTLEPTEVFAVFVPYREYYFLYVVDEESGWYKVLYDKKNNKYGWIKPEKPDDFLGLKDFYTYYGKKHSLYYMKDVDTRTRALRSGPSDTSQKLQGFSITKNIKLVIIRGNWALVSITDYHGTAPKTGFLKWRESDGTIYLFPQME